MKVSNKKRKLQARIADFDAMKAYHTPDGKTKVVVVSGSKTQLYHRPGSIKK